MNHRRRTELVYTRLMLAASIFVCVLLFCIFLGLLYKSEPILERKMVTELLFGSSWNPGGRQFGLYPIILGTIVVTGIAMVIAVPVSLLSALYIAEYLPTKINHPMKAFIDILAGVPSVVYGMCAILILVPFVRDYLAPQCGTSSTGFCVLTAGVTLTVMVFPIIISICVDAFRTVSNDLREASFSLGATKWQTVKHVVFRKARATVFSAVLLGFGRAFGETIAVAMVVGNLPRAFSSVFEPGMTLPSLIASTYGEMMSVLLYDSAIMLAALVLLIIVVLFNVFARLVLRRARKRWA